MKNNYIEPQKEQTVLKAKPETVSFLLAYSKALKVTECNGIKFESNLN